MAPTAVAGCAGLRRGGAGLPPARCAFPRRVYTQSHADYVAEVIEEPCSRRRELRPARIVAAPPGLRHFTARFALD